MSNHKILILKSISDEMTLREMEYLRKKLRKKNLELRVCYALTVREHEERDAFVVPYQELVEKLEVEIKRFEPSILAVHTGAAFVDNPASFLQALAVIKDRYPRIEIKYERLQVPHEDIPPHTFRYGYLSTLLKGNTLFEGEADEVWS